MARIRKNTKVKSGAEDGQGADARVHEILVRLVPRAPGPAADRLSLIRRYVTAAPSTPPAVFEAYLHAHPNVAGELIERVRVAEGPGLERLRAQVAARARLYHVSVTAPPLTDLLLRDFEEYLNGYTSLPEPPRD